MNRSVVVYSMATTVALIGRLSSGICVETRNTGVVHVQHSEIWSKGNVDLIPDVYSKDFIGHFPSGIVRGHSEMRSRVTAHREAFADWTEQVDDIIASGDRVVTRFTSTGTNVGEFLGNPPTNNRVKISEVCIYKPADGERYAAEREAG